MSGLPPLDLLLRTARIGVAAYEAGLALRRDWQAAARAIGSESDPSAVRLKRLVARLGESDSWLLVSIVVYGTGFDRLARRTGSERGILMRAAARALNEIAKQSIRDNELAALPVVATQRQRLTINCCAGADNGCAQGSRHQWRRNDLRRRRRGLEADTRTRGIRSV